jgi:hypothetical protein
MDKNKIINLICIVVILASVAGMGVMLPGVIEKFSNGDEAAQENKEGSQSDEVAQENKEGNQSGDSRKSNTAGCTGQPSIANLTKAEVLQMVEDAFLRNEEIYVNTLCDFVPENVAGNRDFAEFTVTVGNLKNFSLSDHFTSMDISKNTTVDKTDSRYIVITGMQASSSLGGADDNMWGRAVVFDEGDLGYSDTGLAFLKKDRQFIEDVLRIWAYSSVGRTSRFTGASLYSYEMKDIGNTYEFTYSYVSLDFMKLFGGIGQINITQQSWVVDKTTGTIVIDEQANADPLKTYELTEAEFARIQELASHI